MARVVCLGSALQDVYLKDRDDFSEMEIDGKSYFDRLELGQKVDIDSVFFSVGGGATNAAVNFARGDHETIFMGSIGRDPAGRAVLDLLDKENVDTSYIEYAPKFHTGYSVLLLAPSGERTILTYRGASSKFDNLDPDDLDLISPDWLYVTSLRGDMDTLHRFFTKCAKKGIKIMWNPGKLELAEKRKLLGLLPDVEVLLVNKSEAQKIVPGEVLDELLSHLKNLVPTAIITDGSMGAIATNGEKTYRVGLYENVKIKDSTGAGDAFGSGFLSALISGKSFRSALHFASANSTSVVQKIGAKTGILPLNIKLHPMPIQEV